MNRNISRLMTLGVFALMVLFGGGFGLQTYLKLNTNVVFIDNTYPHEVEVALDGEALGPIPMGQSIAVEVDSGDHELVATGPTGELERSSFQVDDGHFRGLYNLGLEGRYILVTARYDAAGGGTTVQAVAPAQSFVALPADVAPDALDLPFPSSMPGGEATLVHLCHYDAGQDIIGCPGA